MAWGRRKETETPSVITLAKIAMPINATTVLGPSVIVTGSIQTEQELLILGKLVGNLTSTTRVHIGPSGEVDGDITCEHLVIEGRVRGNVTTAGHLLIESTGFLTGDSFAHEFVNRPGGFFQGYSHMIPDPATPTLKSGAKNARLKQQDKVGLKET